MRFFFRLWLIWFGFVSPLGLQAIGNAPNPVKAELIAEETAIQSGRPFWVALHLKIDNGWHVYWKNPGDAGIPVRVDWKLPPGFQVKALQWPVPEKLTLEGMVGYGYHSEVVLLVEMTPPANLPSHAIPLQAEVKWLVCSSSACVPGSSVVKLEMNASTAEPSKNESVASIFKAARAVLPTPNEEVKTVEKQGVIQLQISDVGADPETIAGVAFFPEENNVIDHSFEPVVSVDKSSKTGYLVSLKGSDEVGAKVKNLKGVLVVTATEDKGGVHAFDIDSPIHYESDDHFVGFSDALKTLPLPKAMPAPSSSSFEGGVGLAILFAFLGGMILNLMPCVLPVLSLKVMSFVQMAGQKRSLSISHGAMFSLGVIISFWMLAGLMLVLRAYGQSVGWGFQLQEPIFVAILAAILFVFALGMFGLFEWGLSLASMAGQVESDKVRGSSSFTASFFSGVLATAVATPCTGPFLGSAVGFAFTLPVFQALLIFTALGIGMAFPYMILSLFPSCLRFIPKPGPWMKTFKELMGFLLLASVLWLLWVFSAQTNTMSLICLLAAFLCFSIGAWVYGFASNPATRKVKKVFAYAVIVLLVIAGGQIALLPKSTWSHEETSGKPDSAWAGWEDFSPERVAQLEKEGTPFIIDFTAKWCLICQANHLVLASGSVNKKFDEAGVVKIKADWTKSDPHITEALGRYGRNSVPLYVLHSGVEGKEPSILPQVLTSDVVLQHLEQAFSSDEIAMEH